MTNIQKQIPRNLSNTKKSSTKLEKLVRFVNNKNRNNKENNKTHKKKEETNNSEKNITIKKYSVTEIQVSDLDTSTEIEDNDSL